MCLIEKSWWNRTYTANTPCQHDPCPVLVPILLHRPLGSDGIIPVDETVTAAQPPAPQLLHTCPETEELRIWTS